MLSRTFRFALPAAIGLMFLAPAADPAAATGCKSFGSFNHWLRGLADEAVKDGVSRRTVNRALAGITYDPKVISRDRRQGVFSMSFLKFAGRVISKGRIAGGRRRLKQHANLFQRIKRDYGVHGPVLVSFWGLETDFGGNMGDFRTIRSLATLAYDCRRPEKFRPQLIDALRLVDKGDLDLGEMIGAWAGEIGHTQFLPTEYNETAVDYDGDGHRNLRRSIPDAMASSAKLLVKHGWRANEPWLEEVKVPARMDWSQADVAIRHPRSQWAKWGVRTRSGRPIRADSMPASLLLPMGHRGPAFLAYPNFTVAYLEWNNSLVYSTSAAYFATRLAGAPPVDPGNPPTPLDIGEIKQLQRELIRLGYDVGKLDGIIGAQTRAAVKDMQIKLGMPADSYPTKDLLSRLRSR